MSIRRCGVIGCKNQVREGLIRSITSDDGLADGWRCAKCRKAERQRYVREQAKRADPRRHSRSGSVRCAICAPMRCGLAP